MRGVRQLDNELGKIYVQPTLYWYGQSLGGGGDGDGDSCQASVADLLCTRCCVLDDVVIRMSPVVNIMASRML